MRIQMGKAGMSRSPSKFFGDTDLIVICDAAGAGGWDLLVTMITCVAGAQ